MNPMNLAPFAIERYFARHEFSAPHLLCCSDCEPLLMSELLAMADAETTRLWRELTLGYTESPGHPLLRAAVAELYPGLRAEEILVAAPEEGIFLLMHSLLSPGDHVVCTQPAYQSLHEVARSVGCEISSWEPTGSSDWSFDVERLRELMRPDTKLVVVNFPHNPTGFVPTPTEFEALVQVVREHGAWLLSDEMYRFLEIGSNKILPPACTLYERAFSLSGLSKAFGLPGLRVGWLASSDTETLARAAGLKDYTTICNSAPSEILALMALRSRETILERQRERLARNVTVLEEFFGQRPEIFTWKRPLGGSVCFPAMPTVEDTTAFCEELVREAGILLAPSALFQYGHNHIRIGFGRENLPDVLARFGDYLEQRFS
jgi:aspartate/methionine/tyrosine aminotransferase